LRALVPTLALVCACAAPARDQTGDDLGDDHGENPVAHELFDGATLSGWTLAELGGTEVFVDDGRIVLPQGTPLSGLVHANPAVLPREGYELVVRAARLAGTDFFLGLTFPIGTESATCILGGWGGSLCGLSCIDGRDASANETKTYRDFAPGVEVELRVAVTREAVTAWLDDEPLFRVARDGRSFSTRTEVSPCGPLGLAAYQTRAAISRVSLVRRAPAPDRLDG